LDLLEGIFQAPPPAVTSLDPIVHTLAAGCDFFYPHQRIALVREWLEAQLEGAGAAASPQDRLRREIGRLLTIWAARDHTSAAQLMSAHPNQPTPPIKVLCRLGPLFIGTS
jgi:hypothetical protein